MLLMSQTLCILAQSAMVLKYNIALIGFREGE